MEDRGWKIEHRGSTRTDRVVTNLFVSISILHNCAERMNSLLRGWF